ncbi:MAG: cyclic nucleotide-binding protein [Bacteroidetes bacterium]|nr:MAG: cyclic nucleotide-binding protein [Bacteroidota bacterium]
MDHLQSMFVSEKISKGSFYTRVGHSCDKLSFISSGMLRVYASKDDKTITQWISTPGYFVTDLNSLVFDQPSRWNIEALTDCRLYSISKKDYNQLNAQIPGWSQLEKQFLAKCFLTLESRVFSLISNTAEERYNELFALNPQLFNNVPLNNLASMLGMSPETLSRIRAKRTS